MARWARRPAVATPSAWGIRDWLGGWQAGSHEAGLGEALRFVFFCAMRPRLFRWAA